MRHVDRGILLLLALIFVFSSVDKVFHYQGFVNALSDYVLVPRGAAPLLAVPVIVVELMIGLGLLVRPWRQAAALTAAVTLALFTAAIGFNQAYGERGICGCWFTITLAKSTSMHLAQNLLLTALAVNLWWEERNRRRAATPEPSLHPRPGEGSYPTKP